MTDSTGLTSTSSAKRNKNLLLLFSSFLLIASIIVTASTITAHRNHSSSSVAHAILRSTCSSTRYPSLCYSSIAATPSLLHTISTPKDVICASLNLTKTAVKRSFCRVQRLSSTHGNLTLRERTALHDCLEMFDETLDELRRTEADLKTDRHVGDLKILVSAAMTNQESCIDGFSHDEIDRKLRRLVIDGLAHVTHMCSNALAMIKNMTDGHVANDDRRLLTSGEEGFPEWMTSGDRRLMKERTVAADLVVAADGSGDYKTIAAAVAAAPVKSAKRFVIKIKAGRYEENVEVPKKKTNIMFVGDGRKNTVITGRRNVVDGFTTFKSATLGQQIPLPSN